MIRLRVITGILLLLVFHRVAGGDTGQLREVLVQDGMHLVVFTSPTPLRAGEVQLVVLVTDESTGRPLDDYELEVTARADAWEPSSPPLIFAGGIDPTERWSGKSILELNEPGTWQCLLTITRSGQVAQVPMTLTVGQPAPEWWQIAPVALLWVPFGVLVIVRDRLRSPI